MVQALSPGARWGHKAVDKWFPQLTKLLLSSAVGLGSGWGRRRRMWPTVLRTHVCCCLFVLRDELWGGFEGGADCQPRNGW